MSKLLINEPPLQVLPSLVMKVGLNEALFIQQLHWLMQTREGFDADGKTWIRRTVAEWRTQYPWWSERTLKRIIAALTAAGLLVTAEHSTSAWDHTQSYTIDYAYFDKESDDDGPIDSDNLAPSDSAKMAPSSISIKNSKKRGATPTATPSPLQEMRTAWETTKQKHEPGAVILWSADTQAAKALIAKGWTPAQMVACAEVLYADAFFGKDSLSLWTVAKQIAAKDAKARGSSSSRRIKKFKEWCLDKYHVDNPALDPSLSPTRVQEEYDAYAASH